MFNKASTSYAADSHTTVIHSTYGTDIPQLPWQSWSSTGLGCIYTLSSQIGVISSDLGWNRMSPPQLSIFLRRSLSVIGKIVSFLALRTAVSGTFLYCVDFWVLQRSTVWTLHNFIIWPYIFLCHQCNLFQHTTPATCKQIVAWVSVYRDLYEISFKATLLNDFVQTIPCS